MIEENSYSTAKEVLTEYLTKNKHRKSSERYALLKRIYSYNERFTAESLYHDMKDDYLVSLATIYNTLELFLKCNLIIKHVFGTQAAQYEKALGAVAHHYLICTKCNRVTDFSERNFKSTIQAKKFRNFQMQQYSLYIYGKCKRCKKTPDKQN